jgi:hypothetical protein
MSQILVKTFNTPHEAHIFKMNLESYGIECFLRDENLVGLDPMYNIAIGGVKLYIHEEDRDKAIEILKELEPESRVTKDRPWWKKLLGL